VVLGDGTTTIPKGNFSVMVVFFDFITILIFIWFASWLEDRQKTYINKYQDETIEMTDFTVRFGSMPSNKYFEAKEKKLLWALWDKISRVMIDEKGIEEDPDIYINDHDTNFKGKNRL
jgi:hypothetical protein